MKTLSKINDARKAIRATDIKKKGWNDFSKYKYFLPEQISEIVNEACDGLKLFNKFDLLRTSEGLMATLEIFNLDEPEHEPIIFQIATDIPEIKATNVAQQLGGCVTYSERYLLQVAYDIKDNNLDFDTDKKKKTAAPKNDLPWLNPSDTEKWNIAVGRLAKGTLESITKYYRISKVNEAKLKAESLNFVES